MRRKDKEITDRKLIYEILNKAQVCRLGFCKNSTPYVVPVNFALQENSIYIHSAKEGQKIDYIKHNNNVCFEVDINTKLVKSDQVCRNTMSYQSVIGFGKAFLIDDFEEKLLGMDYIVNKYI